MKPSDDVTYGEEDERAFRLGDEIATLSAQLQVATYRLLVMLREFDELGGWAEPGLKSCAHWLSWRTGLDAGAAREKLRVAHALEKLPSISEAMSKGELSYSKVRAITRVATPENEKELLELARGGTAGQVERIVRAWRKIDLDAEKAHAMEQQARAELSVYEDGDGMIVVRGKLPPDIGAVFLKALEAGAERVYREDSERSLEHRQAEALELISEAALANELDPGKSTDRYQVVIHVDEPVLEDPERAGQSAMEGGVGVSAETSRRIACDASFVAMTHDEDGNVLDVGRKTRRITPAIRRALDARDPACVWPGCHSRYVQAHHIVFWAEGGATRLDNLCNLCRYHHHFVHDGGYRVEILPSGALRFTHPGGWDIPSVPEPVRPPKVPLTELTLDEDTGRAGWNGERVNVDALVDTVWRLTNEASPTTPPVA